MSRRRARWLALGAIAAPLLWVLYLAASIAVYARESDPGQAAAAIVLGAAVVDGGPSPVFEERIRHAVTLYRAGSVRVLILTGGVGVGDTLSESEVARRYCLARGVADAHMALERQSHTTHENLRQARPLLAQRELRRVLIVSDPLHMRRAVAEARDLGLDAYPSPTPTTRYVGLASRARFLARETYFYARYLVGRAFRPGATCLRATST